jgi:hypothetical protein
MTINRTTLLDLPLPVTGTESGTWGDITNNGLTQYLDISIAGRNALTSANFVTGDLTIATTEGDSSATNIAATSAQYATLYVSSLAQNSTITAPSSNRAYRVVNADSTYTLTVKAAGQTGVTFPIGTSGTVVFNGTDYVILGTFGSATTLKLNGSSSGTATLAAPAAASTFTYTLPAATTTLAGLAATQTFSVSQRGTVTTDNDGSFDMNATNNFLCTPSGAFTLTFTNITAGQSGNIVLVNGSNYTVSAAATTKVATGALTAISATGTYWLSYFSPDGTNVYVANTAALA